MSIGWHISCSSGDSKKSKSILRWVTVSDCWLLISARPTDSPIHTIHLGFCEVKPAWPDQSPYINSLSITTGSYYGDLPVDPFVLHTQNRYDILDLDEALTQGRKLWDETVASGTIDDTAFRATFKERKSGLLGAKSVDCALTPEAFTSARQGSEPLTIPLGEVTLVRMAPTDSGKGAACEIGVTKVIPAKDLQFQSSDVEQMRRFVKLFLYLLARRGDCGK
jgi:hypothetical protein